MTTSDTTSHMDEALAVLQGTHDGDDLTQEDLALLETIVNFGPEALTERGRNHWSQLVGVAREGKYQRPWLHGVIGLTKSQDGFVYWHDAPVEHYSHKDPVKEAKDAKELGMACTLAERRGLPVNWTNISRIFDDLRFGQGIVAPRFHVMWTANPLNLRLTAVRDSSTDVKVFETQAAAHRASASTQWDVEPTEGSLRYTQITSTEGFDQVVQQLLSDKSWMRAVFQARMQSVTIDLVDELHRQVDRDALLTNAQIESSFYAESAPSHGAANPHTSP